MKSKPLPVTSKSPQLRVGLNDVSRKQFSAAVNERLGKQRVSIMLDGVTEVAKTRHIDVSNIGV